MSESKLELGVAGLREEARQAGDGPIPLLQSLDERIFGLLEAPTLHRAGLSNVVENHWQDVWTMSDYGK